MILGFLTLIVQGFITNVLSRNVFILAFYIFIILHETTAVLFKTCPF